MRHQRLYGRLAREEIEAQAAAQPDPNADPLVAAAEAPATVEEGAAPAEVLPEGSDGLEAELISVNNDIVDLQADEASNDEAVEVIDEMNVAVESLRIIAGNGGLDKGGAQLLNLMQASWNRRLDLESNHNTLSTESFGGSNSRAGQTVLAAESIAEKAKGVWATIVELFKKAMAAIADIWKRIFDGAAKTKARAEKLIAVAKAVKGAANASNFEDKGLADALHINGKVDVKAAVKALETESNQLAALSQHAIAFAGEVEKSITSGSEGPNAVLQKAAALAQGGGFSKVADPASVGMSAMEGVELFKGAVLPGNKAIVAIVPVLQGEVNAAVLKNVGYKIGIGDASRKAPENGQLTTASPQDVVALAEEMVKIADKVSHYQPLQKQAEAEAKKLIAAAEKAARAAGTDASNKQMDEDGMNKDSTGGKAIAALQGWAAGVAGQQVAKAAMSLVTNAAPPVAAYVLNAASAVLQYGEKSLKQYGANKPEEKKPAEGAAAPAAAAA